MCIRDRSTTIIIVDALSLLLRVALGFVRAMSADEARASPGRAAGGLALDGHEMTTIQAHFASLQRAPTRLELETLAQTWSEHCKHKTLTGTVQFGGQRIDNLLKSTIAKVTHDLDRDFCVSVFVDNAGIIKFDDVDSVCIKVETHNRPSAIEPFGGAGTGVGGVIRDVLGTCLLYTSPSPRDGLLSRMPSSA